MCLLRTAILDTRGIALPLALLSLLLFTSLALALIAVAQTEPIIAANHLHAAQARALADSAIAHAAWALTEAGEVAGDGTALTVGRTGAFELTVTGADPYMRATRAIGRSARGGARAAVVATLVRVRELAREAPCALCMGAAVALAASVADARGSEATECGEKVGVASTAAVGFDAASVAYGGGAPAGTPAHAEGRDWRHHQPLATWLSASELQTLKALAALRGRYIRPPSDARAWLPDGTGGLVFVDVPAPTGDRANVALGGRFRGWLIANGNIALEAGADVEGLLYAVNAITTDGPAAVTGMVIAQHAFGGESTLGELALRFDCAAARSSGEVPRGWFLLPGTYCDGTSGC